jgi:predicted O-methyltransferase YrrM
MCDREATDEPSAGWLRAVEPLNVRVMRGDHVEDAVDFEIDGVRFVGGFVDRGAENRFTLRKPASLLKRYELLLREFERPRMVELGIAYGGSLAYFALRVQPSRLVGIEYKAGRLGHLDQFIESRGLGEVVRPYYGVDQADGDRVREIMATEFGDEPIDLVVDDASHRYTATLASFEALFPWLRPGGVFVIEDWAGLHEMADAYEQRLAQATPTETERLAALIAERIESGVGAETPLSRLAIEFMLAQTPGTGLIEDLTVNRHCIAVRRGLAPLPATGFRLADHYTDSFGMVGPQL